MRSVLENLFEKGDFRGFKMEGDEFGFTFFAPPVGSLKKSYYLVGFIAEDKIKMISSGNEVYSEWFTQAIKRAETNGYPDEYTYKNISLILCVECNSNEEQLRKSIYEIEENPYFFRKYVLQYSEGELIALKGRLDEEGTHAALRKILFDSKKHEEFLKSKAGKTPNIGSKAGEVDAYALASRLCIKISFLKVYPGNNSKLETTLDSDDFLNPDQKKLRTEIIEGDSNE